MERKIPVTHPQKRVLDSELIDRSTDKYLILPVYTIKNADVERVRRAVEKVIEGCGDLNLRFHVGDDGATITQYRGKPDCARIKQLVFAGREKERKKWLDEHTATPFDPLWDAPLYEFTILTGEEDCMVYAKLHHAIVDGTGTVVLGTLIDASYHALQENKSVDMPCEYLSYLEVEKAYLESSVCKEDRAYWMEQIADTSGFPEAIAKETTECGSYDIKLPETATKQLNAYCTGSHVRITPYKLALAAISIYLSRRYRSDSVPILAAYAGRRGLPAGLEKTIGMLVSTMVLRMEYHPEMTFNGYISETDKVLKEALAHARFPFDWLTEELAARGEELSKLWNFSVVSNSKADTECGVDYLYSRHAAFALVFRVNVAMEDALGLQCIRIEYFKDVFTRDEIVRMAEGIEAMLQDIAEHPQKPICELTLLGETEKRFLLENLRGKELAYDRDGTFVDIFRKMAAQYPDQAAVVDADSLYTYHELNLLSDRLAFALEEQYSVRGHFASVMLPRKKEFFLAVVSVMKAGSAYVPVDSGYPQDRIEYMLSDSESAVLITTKEYAEKIGNFSGRILYLEELSLLGETPAPPAPRGEELAYMIYTSGSTGRPKGVMIRHDSLAALVAWKTHDHEIGPGSRVCVHSSFSFDASVIDIFPALAAGAALHVIGESMRFDMAGFYQYLKDNKIEDCTIPTQLGMELLRAYEVPLRRVMLGGEKLQKLPKRKVTLCNGYGPTEFTVASSYYIVDQDREYGNIPIGKPVANTWNYVMDKHAGLIPFGCAGELCLAGAQIAKGYWKREDLTEKVFVENPYATCADNRLMYRTGDLVRWNADGDLEYLGRIDDQIKLRGFRIELGEVESAAVSFAGVEAAVVLVQKDMLVAYYVSASPVDENALTAHLSTRLPEYMVPVAFLRLDRMPLTPGGKVDKKALPKIELAAMEIVPPKNQMQREILSIVSEVIGNAAIGITTDLFYAGMSSLSAIKITARISKKYGISLGAQEVIRGKTIQAIEAAITQNEKTQTMQYDTRESYPLTQSQMGVYLDFAKRPGTLKYNIPSALVFSRRIDAAKLAESFGKVIEAHPYVKTHLAMRGQTLQQIRCDDLPVLVPVFTVTEEELRLARSAFIKPFNLFEGPLFRAAVYHTPETTCLLSDFHHIVFDGGSMDILMKDLERAYAGKELTREEWSAFDVALLEEDVQSGKEYSRAEAYFTEKLKDCDGATEIAGDRPGPEEQGNLKQETAGIDREKVRAFCMNNGVTPSNLFLTGTVYTAGRFSGNKTVLLSTLSNGRGETAFQNIFGMMVKTLPLIVLADGALTSAAFVRETQQAMFDTMANDCYPFTRISEKYHFSPQIMYAFQSGILSGCVLDGQAALFESLEQKTPKFKISVHIEEDDKEFKVCVQYNDALYSAELMRTFSGCIAMAVCNVMDRPDAPSAKLSLLPEEERALLERFNDTKTENEIRVLHKMFEKQAAQNSEKTALMAADGSYTYARLNASANRIANALIQKGVVVEDRVAFMLPRDGRLIAAMLGIMKAGAAYIPIDPEYPAERITHILTDSRARFMIACAGMNGQIGGEQTLDVDELLLHENTADPEQNVAPENLCYIIYTSGSTGKPKGVMLEHNGISNYVAPTEKNIHVRALVETDAVLLSVTTVSFDMFLKEGFTVLMNGLTLVFATEEQANNPAQLAELFAATGANAFNATPSRLLQYLDLDTFREALRKCRVVMAGGEKYPGILFETLRKITGARLFNTYGPTEITVSSNAKELTDEHISVGAPLSNVREYIVDTDGNLLPIGITGELYIGGAGVARGYFGNAQLTAKSFIQTKEGRLYKTGDFAKWTRNGEVVILGRSDNQVKLRGLRIELGEIQTAVCKYHGIKSAAAVIRKVQGNEHICAYFISDAEVDIEKLRENLKDSLTKYMIPTAYMQINAFPVTPNGKTDYNALPEPTLMARHEYVEPENKMQKDFCEIFSQVLGIEKIGAGDNFFDLGGTSLLVTKVTIEAMNRGYNISYGDVFTHPTPAEIDGLQKSAQEEGGDEDIGKYDYTAINELLKKNTIEAFLNGEKQKLGNVLLTGATGFLGIHVLKEFIEGDKGMIYCFMRKGRQASLEKRLKSMLVYYFNNSYDELFGARIFPVDGDITQPADFEKLKDLPIDTVINCAANVKHYAQKTEIENINVGGVANAIDFCMEKGCRLVHISTTSVAGISVDGVPSEDTILDERMLYIGQNLENKYIGSKFRSERLILDAVSKGLQAKIMRVGNLMARNRDGEFQINFHTNGFVNRLRAYAAIGQIAFSAMGAATEFAPIDSTAQAILKLACTPKECCVFHPYNNHSIYIGDVIEVMNERGITVQPVEDGEFEKTFSCVMRDKDKAEAISGLIAYLNMGRGKRVFMLHNSNDYTVQALYRIGFKWPLTTDGYLDKFIALLNGLGFFERGTIDV